MPIVEAMALLTAASIWIIAFYFLPATAALYLIRYTQAQRIARRGWICLTFDDGPHPQWTPAILAVLRQHDIRATFFALTRSQESVPALLRIHYEGHDVAQHGGRHLHPWRVSPARYWVDLRESLRSILKVVPGGLCSLYRPTFGKANLLTMVHVFLGRMKIVYWTVDPEDYSEHVPEALARRIMTTLPPPGKGAVILLHDGRATAGLSDGCVTVEGLRTALPLMLAQGRRFATISQALSRGD